MPRRILLVVVLIAAGVGARAAPPTDLPPYDPDKPLPDAERERRINAVEIGLSPNQVRLLIGAPRHVSRQVLYHRCLEQWIYDSTFPVRLEFEYPRGQEPRLQSVQWLGPPGH
jgi:hypothetical protein